MLLDPTLIGRQFTVNGDTFTFRGAYINDSGVCIVIGELKEANSASQNFGNSKFKTWKITDITLIP